jgi:TRAP-type C4-dicarboxylate transport system permease small subunit
LLQPLKMRGEFMRKSGITIKGAQQFFRAVNTVFDALAALSTALIFVIVIYQVLGRVLGHPAPWTEEGTRFVFIWMIFLGLGIGFRKGESARVTQFIRWAPQALRRMSKWIYLATSAGFFLFMFITGIQLTGQQIALNELGSALMIPMWIVGISVPVSACLGILGLAENFISYPDRLE